MSDFLASEPTPEIPDPFSGQLSIRLIGDMSLGGTIEFFLLNERVDEPLPIPKTEWAALALLAEGALKPAGLRGFINSRQLAVSLAKCGVVDSPDPLVAVRIIFRLRKRLNRLAVAAKLVPRGYLTNAEDFGAKLISRWPVLGYGLSLPANRVSLHFVDSD